MANTKLLFYGTRSSKTNDYNLECFANEHNEIFLKIDCDPGGEFYKAHICLNKSTAIKLHRELKKQISFIDDFKIL